MNIQKLITEHYQSLLSYFSVNQDSGILGVSNPDKNLKFPTYPYIGSKYGDVPKILFVGLDIGADEKEGFIQSFEERQFSIENKPESEHNEHIAGTYFTAMYYLQDELSLQDYWQELKNFSSCQRAIKSNKVPDVNPLSYVALSNYFKFVYEKRKNRSGGRNRKHLDKYFEIDFFIKEVQIFDPDIIIFQSKVFIEPCYKKLLSDIKQQNREIYIGPHPSWRRRKEPEYFLEQIKPLN